MHLRKTNIARTTEKKDENILFIKKIIIYVIIIVVSCKMLTFSDFQLLYLFFYKKCDYYTIFGVVAVFTMCIDSVFVDCVCFPSVC